MDGNSFAIDTLLHAFSFSLSLLCSALHQLIIPPSSALVRFITPLSSERGEGLVCLCLPHTYLRARSEKPGELGWDVWSA